MSTVNMKKTLYTYSLCQPSNDEYNCECITSKMIYKSALSAFNAGMKYALFCSGDDYSDYNKLIVREYSFMRDGVPVGLIVAECNLESLRTYGNDDNFTI